MKRIIVHWTAGSPAPSGLDKQHYHRIIDGLGNVHDGVFPISANAGPLKSGGYAAHTLNCNTGSIGVALAAMAGAIERPFSAGKYPITAAQEKSLTSLLVKLCDEYGIPITRETVLTHAEVQPTLGIKQKGKWDIAWLPGMTQPGDPVAVGDTIRQRVAVARRTIEHVPPVMSTKPGFLNTLLDLMARIFGGKK